MMSIAVRCCWMLAACVLLGIMGSAQAAERPLIADVEQFYPAMRGARGGGVAAVGASTMDAPKSPNGRPMLRLSSKAAPVQGAWWFPGHAPLTNEQALIGDSRGRLVIEVESATPTTTDLQVQWRVDGTAGEWVRSQPMQLSPNRSVEIVLPIPALTEGAKINGIMLSFGKPGEYRIRRLAIGRLSNALIAPVDDGALRLADKVSIGGRAAAGINEVAVSLAPEGGGDVVTRKVAVKDGTYTLQIARGELKPGTVYSITATAGSNEPSPPQRLFAYPAITGKQCLPVTREGADLIRDGKRFGFVGVNYTPFLLGLGMRADFEAIARDVIMLRDLHVRVVRVPIHIGSIQPALGVMPDSPQYKELLAKHGHDTSFVEQLDYFVALAGEMGIYTVIDWHGMPTDPYRYFVGGREQDRNSGKPGTAISYLAPSPTERGEFDLSDPRHVQTLLNAHRWVAAHFRGNPNLLGIEVPFNEPHTTYMAIEANYRRITDLAAKAVAEGDPDRLTFALGPSFSHNNLLPSVTWLPPDRLAGGAPHFYQANGPVPLRADAKQHREPWLARESEGTFGWSFPAALMPFSAVDYPIYNGETGAHGAQMVLPDKSLVEASSILIEAQLVQEYATGMVGRLEWTLWDNANAFHPLLDTYKTLFSRFAPVYEAGPLDRSHAEVLFVQHPEATASSNGHNFACIPLAKAALDLQLGVVHYMTDDQFRYIAAAEMAVGLEQVVATSEELKYKAIIVDRRELGTQTKKMIEAIKSPVLWLESAEDLTAEKLAAFLKTSGVKVDQRTPRELQVIDGTEHLIVYRRLDGGENPTRAYPILKRQGEFQLVDEQGTLVFQGTAATLAEQGLAVDLPLWRSAIYQVKPIR